MVEGHIAPIAGSTYSSGLPLSRERANNVKNYCVSIAKGGNSTDFASTLIAVGYSNTQPIYKSNGEADLAASRRVAFRVMLDIE
jgi:outer membrane protein OmpA-like peptidoglycan-associated protein